MRLSEAEDSKLSIRSTIQAMSLGTARDVRPAGKAYILVTVFSYTLNVVKLTGATGSLSCHTG